MAELHIITIKKHFAELSVRFFDVEREKLKEKRRLFMKLLERTFDAPSKSFRKVQTSHSL